MAYEIIYVCDSINNKNVREGELNILEKYEEQLYFVFGSDEMNTKKRFYNDIETLNKDFDALLKLKEKETKLKKVVEELNEDLKKDYKKSEEIDKKETKKTPKEEKTDKYKIIKRKK